jgi:hypothetical protein
VLPGTREARQTGTMISTYLSYRSYTADLTKTLTRVSLEAQVSRDAQYYKDNIGKVKSVDDFIDNTRLFSYAMKAYGLEDMTYAKAFMRKVLESDVNDSKSFVGKLTDPRFMALAKAFNFSTDGTVTTSPVAAQETADENDTIGLYSEQRIRLGTAAASGAEYYQNNIGTVRSVDELLSRPQLLNYALVAYGLDPNITSNVTLRAVLTSDLSDPGSYANQLTNPGYRALAAAFSFQPDGSVAAGETVQSNAQIQDTVYLNYDATGAGASPAGAAFKTKYYQDNISSVTTVDDLLANSKLIDYAVTAFGLDPVLQSKATLRAVLTSDLSDPNSVANKQASASYRALAAAFNFQTDGTIAPGAEVQSADQLNNAVDLYSADYDDSAVSAENTETAYYQQRIGGITSVDDLLNDGRLYNYVLTAFGLDPNSESKMRLKLILESDPTNPGSYVNTVHNESYKALAAAFNFGSDGKAKTVSSPQTNNDLSSIIGLYSAQSGSASPDQTTAESTYYSETISSIGSVDDFLKDQRLVAYALQAYGFKDQNVSNDVLRKILTSDPLDPKSFVNQKGNTDFRALATAFNFGSDGNVLPVPQLQPQDRSDLVATSDLYLRQSMEQEAGSDNDGVRLALYFQRMAPTITSPFSILADKALLQVVQTALGLPVAMSNADIDLQANMITKKLDLADLQDPKKLEKFIARFSALYDLNNSDSSPLSLATMLFSPPK